MCIIIRNIVYASVHYTPYTKIGSEEGPS